MHSSLAGGEWAAVMPGGRQGRGVGSGSLHKFPEVSHTLTHRPLLQGTVTKALTCPIFGEAAGRGEHSLF